MSCIDCTQWFPTLLARRMLAGRVGAAAVQDLQPCRAAEPGRGSSLTQGAGAREKVAILVEAARREEEVIRLDDARGERDKVG